MSLFVSFISLFLPFIGRWRNKNAVRKITRAFNTGDIRLIDEVIDPNIVDQSTKFMGPDGFLRGFDGVKQQVRMIREAFPDVHFEELTITAETDNVVLLHRMTGTNTGRFFGREPTNRRISHRQFELLRLKGGKIIGHSDSAAPLEILDKVGLLDTEMLQELERIGVRRYESD